MSDLTKFTKEMVKIYNTGVIKAPVHFSGGGEKKLREVFQNYKDGDWIFSTWRSHWHWLLSGRSPERLKEQILDGYSMHIFDQKFFTSSIVSGISPIALGVAYALKLKNSMNNTFCFLGDMAASSGLSQECFRFATGHELPITYVIEDNGLSVTTPTNEVWGNGKKKVVMKYKYKRKYNHAGSGAFVFF